MAGAKNGVPKIDRILGLYHLLRHCREVSYEEVTNMVVVSKKTIRRDIRVLAQIGYTANFSKENKAFILDKTRGEVQLPERKNQRLYLQRLIRLTRIMNEVENGEDPAPWYRTNYPELSARTMQRDFQTLCGIGYDILYIRNFYNPKDLPVGTRYCEWPDVYGLYFRRAKKDSK
jgi:hypothetical protein